MLKITRAANGEVVIKLSGRMDAENVGELETLVRKEDDGRRIVLDLRDSNPRGSRQGQFSEALRRGQHHAQELPGIYPRVDHERTTRRVSVKHALAPESRTTEGSEEWQHK